ncbi:MAG: sugar ABC transporter ATP-binding protein [Corynebacterium casei]|uniref:sugar ABC transporter ATP-binding protein n=1 Tax=Corynebacterium casei TaxID=160386 RepID=UPI00264719BF|nr:sugar ABC transporter ATP-binding protein [Corynebacterium casei]MDN5707414.1 sugar ABC transporter ATP-binding protein [Corynebacterium casei]MDN5730013.1 sugar ABC transporter ATP-binding protein [Corynebacterium casei]MDN5903495.1 sugar ABC transporter ATP-binding protein [Corynebacterium casei]MDN6156008.1 sugar ABC transporter ATP-binding protein [Corynebacterium casei]MDN6416727.1 sugar ABC transporter ATP-binding protein [Corynebacterium casei]
MSDNNLEHEAVLQLANVSKSFGPVNVIKDVSLSVRRGQVQALLGENGAGKSTLIKMIAGVHAPDSGKILIDGTEVTIASTNDSEAYGIATIHQELNLVPTLSVAENIMLGRTPKRFGLVNYKHLNAQAQAALNLIGLDVPLKQKVGELGIAKQQLIEIAKALSMNARILILDEPTAALTGKEVDALFAILDELKAKGVAMVFISHHLDELARIADTISILRDGEFVAEVPASTDEDTLVQHMVGRAIEDQYPRGVVPETGAPLLEVNSLSSSGSFNDVSFTVHAGEVVGLAGLVGAGRTEVVRAIAGADKYDSGQVLVSGKKLKAGDIQGAIRAGVGHIPEDRKGQALVLDGTVNENLGYATLGATAKAGLADRSGQKRRAQEVAEKLRIRMANIDQPIRNLSGGNQQKAVFGRWVLAQSNVLLLDEPTRGVDVGAKVEIYNIINEITANGGAVLMVSSDLPEVLGMSDRILVMSGGQLAGELPKNTTQDEIMALAVSNLSSAASAETVAAGGHEAAFATIEEESK